MPGALSFYMKDFFLVFVQNVIDLVQLEYFQWIFMGFVGFFAIAFLHRIIWGH